MNLTRKHNQIQILKTNIFTKEKRGWEAINQDFGINTYKLVYIKQIKKKTKHGEPYSVSRNKP